ncbi:hypothetical protein DMENIID0001_137060 [Sergentomyia squamirostris]
MEQWKNRVAVVTGASSGIGAAIAKDLVKAGMITIGLARRVDRIEKLKEDLPKDLGKNLHALKCDITKENEIIQVFSEIDEKFGGIHVLINNAGLNMSIGLIDKANSDRIHQIIDTNILGAIFCTREAYKSMSKHGINSHVIHMNSILGHMLPLVSDRFNSSIYSASKHALKVINEVHRQEFIQSKHHIKVSSISPGQVKTDMSFNVLGIGEKYYSKVPHLQPEDVAQSVLHILGTPPHVQIHELIIKPFGETW